MVGYGFKPRVPFSFASRASLAIRELVSGELLSGGTGRETSGLTIIGLVFSLQSFGSLVVLWRYLSAVAKFTLWFLAAILSSFVANVTGVRSFRRPCATECETSDRVDTAGTDRMGGGRLLELGVEVCQV